MKELLEVKLIEKICFLLLSEDEKLQEYCSGCLWVMLGNDSELALRIVSTATENKALFSLITLLQDCVVKKVRVYAQSALNRFCSVDSFREDLNFLIQRKPNDGSIEVSFNNSQLSHVLKTLFADGFKDRGILVNALHQFQIENNGRYPTLNGIKACFIRNIPIQPNFLFLCPQRAKVLFRTLLLIQKTGKNSVIRIKPLVFIILKFTNLLTKETDFE